VLLFLFLIASPLIRGAGFSIRVKSCYRALERSAGRPGHEQNTAGIGVPQFKDAFLSAPCVRSRLDVDWIICQNLLDFIRFNVMRGEVSFVVLIPVIPASRRRVCTLYRH
jgi:hypothetical protein